jgi:hypothetical protein
MPKYTPNGTLVQSISGAIGDLVFYRDDDGNFIVQHKWERTAPPSQKQVAQKERFSLASAYGNRVKLDPALSAEYRPLCRGRMRPYQAGLLPPPSPAAHRSWWKPPLPIALETSAWPKCNSTFPEAATSAGESANGGAEFTESCLQNHGPGGSSSACWLPG